MDPHQQTGSGVQHAHSAGESANYEGYWRRRHRKWMVRFALLGGFLPSALLVTLLNKWLHADDEFWRAAWFYTYAGVTMVAFVVALYFPCPRCGKQFTTRCLFTNALASKCLHCGLPRGARSDPDGKPEGANAP